MSGAQKGTRGDPCIPDHICEDVVEAFCVTYRELDETLDACGWNYEHAKDRPKPKEVRQLAAILTVAASVRREDTDRQILDAWEKEERGEAAEAARVEQWHAEKKKAKRKVAAKKKKAKAQYNDLKAKFVKAPETLFQEEGNA